MTKQCMTLSKYSNVVDVSVVYVVFVHLKY